MMQKWFHRLRSFCFVIIVLMTASGCVPLIIGAAVGVGGYAWVNGELSREVNVSAERLHRAATRAVKDLKLTVKEDKGDRISAKIKAEFYDGTDVNIHVEAKTEQKSQVKIRVGLLGDKEKSEAVMNAIIRRI